MENREYKKICMLNHLERADQYSAVAFDLLDSLDEAFELKASGLLREGNERTIAWVLKYYDRVSASVVAAKNLLDATNELIHDELIR